MVPHRCAHDIHEEHFTAGPTVPIPFTPEDDVLPVLLLRCADTNRNDLHIPFTPDVALWSGADDRCVNLLTGEAIAGRQQFPPCLEVDGAMLHGTAEDLLCFEDRLFARKVGGVESGNKVLRIANHLDFLVHQAGRLHADL
jgi:hypothetical protein